MITHRSLIVSLAAVCIGLSACGSSAKTAAPTAAPAASTAASTAADGPARGAAYQAFTVCMSTNGVTLPARVNRNGGGATAPTGVDQAAYTKALAACQDKVPTGGFGGGFGGGGRLNNPAYVACMKDNGITLPTPIDRTSPGYVAANAKCKVLLPNGGVPTVSTDGASSTAGTTTSIGG